MNSPHYFSAKALNDEIIARLLKDEDRLVISKSFSGDKHCGWHITALKWFTEFGHLNRGDMLTSEQHRCHNEKKKFQRRV